MSGGRGIFDPAVLGQPAFAETPPRHLLGPDPHEVLAAAVDPRLDECPGHLEEVANVEPWTTSFNPGTTTLERLLELTREVDFAAFVFARDDWTTIGPPESDPSVAGQASPRDNVVFEAGLFGAALGMRRTFILHASGSKLPSDLLGLTCVRYEETTAAA